MSPNLHICPYTLDIDRLNFIVLSPNNFPTIVHAGNRHFAAQFDHDSSFIVAKHNPVEEEVLMLSWGQNEKDTFCSLNIIYCGWDYILMEKLKQTNFVMRIPQISYLTCRIHKDLTLSSHCTWLHDQVKKTTPEAAGKKTHRREPLTYPIAQTLSRP